MRSRLWQRGVLVKRSFRLGDKDPKKARKRSGCDTFSNGLVNTGRRLGTGQMSLFRFALYFLPEVEGLRPRCPTPTNLVFLHFPAYLTCPSFSIPYERSFSIQGDKVVVMGWPIRGKPFQQPPATLSAWVQEARLYPLTLDVVRHAAQVHGVLHAYHRALTDVDNDLFFRIGLLVDQTSLTERVRETLETEARQFLSIQPPLILNIRLDQVSVALYEEDTLPRSSTRVWSLADPYLTASAIMEHLR